MSFGERSARFIPPRHPWIPAICESRWEYITGEMASVVDKASQPHIKTPNIQTELVLNLRNISERSILRSGMNVLEVDLGSPRYQQSVRTCAQERSKQFSATQPEGHPTRNLKHDNQIPRRRTYLYERCTVYPSHSLDQLKMLALRLRPHWGPMRLVCKWSALL